MQQIVLRRHLGESGDFLAVLVMVEMRVGMVDDNLGLHHGNAVALVVHRFTHHRHPLNNHSRLLHHWEGDWRTRSVQQLS